MGGWVPKGAKRYSSIMDIVSYAMCHMCVCSPFQVKKKRISSFSTGITFVHPKIFDWQKCDPA